MKHNNLANMKYKGHHHTSNRAPLRKIVLRRDGMEKLECGHTQVCREDFIGPTYALSRRCKACMEKK